MTTKQRPFPRVLRVEPASQCNLSCTHCPTGTVDMPREVMSAEVFSKVLNEIETHQNAIKVIVLYHGGEPLLNKRFFEMVRSIKAISTDLYIKTVTNGMGLTAKNAKKLVESGIDSVEFSLDGVSAEESQQVRVKSDTLKIVQNIQRYLTLKKESDKETEVFISTTQFVRDREGEPPKGDPEVPEWLMDEFAMYDIKFKTTYALRWPHMGNSGKYDFLKGTNAGVNTDECDHILNTLTVRSDGSIVPCCYDLTSRLTMGNVQEQSLMDIWNGSRYEKLRESIVTENYISICSTCAVVRPPVYLVPKWDIPTKRLD